MLSNAAFRRRWIDKGRGDADIEIMRLQRLLDAQSVRLQQKDAIIMQQRRVIAELRKVSRGTRGYGGA